MNIFEQYGKAVWQLNVWKARTAKLEQQLAELQNDSDKQAELAALKEAEKVAQEMPNKKKETSEEESLKKEESNE